MEYKIEKFEYSSTNSKTTIHGISYIPNGKIKAIIQISHGMCENIYCYEEFAKYFASRGILVCGNCHIGHGDSINSKDEYGFFADNKGDKYLIEDVHTLTLLIKKRYMNIPYFLLGHSMGSFIARCYISKYGNEIDGALILGTAGPNPLIDAAINLANTFCLAKGNMFRSRKINQLSCGVFNSQFKPTKTIYDWTTSNEEICKKYQADSTRNFTFTASGFKDLFKLHKVCNLDKTFENTPKDLPILIMSGSQDPVGENGRGVANVYQKYYLSKHQNLDMRIYKNARHEVLNDFCKDKAYYDIENFIKKVICE